MGGRHPYSMSRYLIGAFLLLGLGIVQMGIIGNAAQSPYTPASALIYESSLLNKSPIKKIPETKFVHGVVITAYSSRVIETDSTPFITASGTTVRPGVIAANWLPFGTKIKIPELFGDRIFTVEDRMNRRNHDKVDVWFRSTSDALNFGVRKARVEIL